MTSRLKEAVRKSTVGMLLVPEEGVVERDFLFSPDFLGFSGHFPGRPVLPAVVQVLAAVSAVEEAEGSELELRRIDKAKFVIQVGPEDKMTALCIRRSIGEEVSYVVKMTVAGKLASSFILYPREREDE